MTKKHRNASRPETPSSRSRVLHRTRYESDSSPDGTAAPLFTMAEFLAVTSRDVASDWGEVADDLGLIGDHPAHMALQLLNLPAERREALEATNWPEIALVFEAAERIGVSELNLPPCEAIYAMFEAFPRIEDATQRIVDALGVDRALSFFSSLENIDGRHRTAAN